LPVTAIDENGNPTAFGDQFAYVARDGSLLFTQVQNEVDPFGGNVLIEGSAELLFPLPFIKDQSQIRTGFFLDAGNVFDTNCGSTQAACYDVDLGELRYSVGVGLTWITGFGPMSFSLAQPLNSDEFDQEEVFQFTLGRGF
jgi:outer membrane protein insertion porin family